MNGKNVTKNTSWPGSTENHFTSFFFFGARESHELTLEDAPLLIIGLNLRGGRVVRCSVRVYIAVITFRFDHFFDRTMSKWEVSGAFSMVVKLR